MEDLLTFGAVYTLNVTLKNVVAVHHKVHLVGTGIHLTEVINTRVTDIYYFECWYVGEQYASAKHTMC